jgi:hypothetical protein
VVEHISFTHLEHETITKKCILSTLVLLSFVSLAKLWKLLNSEFLFLTCRTGSEPVWENFPIWMSAEIRPILTKEFQNFPQSHQWIIGWYLETPQDILVPDIFGSRSELCNLRLKRECCGCYWLLGSDVVEWRASSILWVDEIALYFKRSVSVTRVHGVASQESQQRKPRMLHECCVYGLSLTILISAVLAWLKGCIQKVQTRPTNVRTFASGGKLIVNIVACGPISRQQPKYAHAIIEKVLQEVFSIWSAPFPLLGNGSLNTFPQKQTRGTIRHILLGNGVVNRLCQKYRLRFPWGPCKVVRESSSEAGSSVDATSSWVEGSSLKP